MLDNSHICRPLLALKRTGNDVTDELVIQIAVLAIAPFGPPYFRQEPLDIPQSVELEGVYARKYSSKERLILACRTAVHAGVLTASKRSQRQIRYQVLRLEGKHLTDLCTIGFAEAAFRLAAGVTGITVQADDLSTDWEEVDVKW